MKRDKLNHILFIHSDIGLHMHACVHVRFTCKKSSSGQMLSRGCVPIPRYVIQYNTCPSICISQSNEALQPKLNYLLIPKLLLRSQIVDGRTFPGPVNQRTHSDFPSLKSYVEWSPSRLFSTPKIHQTRSALQGSNTHSFFFQ